MSRVIGRSLVSTLGGRRRIVAIVVALGPSSGRRFAIIVRAMGLCSGHGIDYCCGRHVGLLVDLRFLLLGATLLVAHSDLEDYGSIEAEGCLEAATVNLKP